MQLVTYVGNNDLMKHYKNRNSTDITEKAMGVDLVNIINWVMIFLFIKNLYNKDIRRRVVGMKVINTLAGTFKLDHHSLLKLRKYEGLIYNKEQNNSQLFK